MTGYGSTKSASVTVALTLVARCSKLKSAPADVRVRSITPSAAKHASSFTSPSWPSNEFSEVGAADAAEAVTRGRHRKHAASRFAIRSRGRTVTSMSFVAVIIESSGDTLSESSICWVYSTGIA